MTVTEALMGPAAGSGGGAAGPGPGSSTAASGTDAVPPGGRFRRYIAARLLHTGGHTVAHLARPLARPAGEAAYVVGAAARAPGPGPSARPPRARRPAGSRSTDV
ncbi:hypothetical protein ACWDAO_35455 [Streptomyces sp. NPDC001212]